MLHCDIQEKASFLDFIRGGYVTLAICFLLLQNKAESWNKCLFSCRNQPIDLQSKSIGFSLNRECNCRKWITYFEPSISFVGQRFDLWFLIFINFFFHVDVSKTQRDEFSHIVKIDREKLETPKCHDCGFSLYIFR